MSKNNTNVGTNKDKKTVSFSNQVEEEFPSSKSQFTQIKHENKGKEWRNQQEADIRERKYLKTKEESHEEIKTDNDDEDEKLESKEEMRKRKELIDSHRNKTLRRQKTEENLDNFDEELSDKSSIFDRFLNRILCRGSESDVLETVKELDETQPHESKYSPNEDRPLQRPDLNFTPILDQTQAHRGTTPTNCSTSPLKTPSSKERK